MKKIEKKSETGQRRDRKGDREWDRDMFDLHGHC